MPPRPRSCPSPGEGLAGSTANTTSPKPEQCVEQHGRRHIGFVSDQVTDTLLVNRLGDDAQPQQVQPHHHHQGAGGGGELSFHGCGAGAAARVEADKAVCDPCSPSATACPR